MCNCLTNPKFNNYLRILSVLISILFVQFFTRGVSAQSQLTENSTTSMSILIRFDENATEAERGAIIGQAGGTLVNWLPQIHVAEVNFPINANQSGSALQQQFQRVKNQAAVHYFEEDTVVTGTYTPNDPDLYNPQRGYSWRIIHATSAWDFTTGSSNVVVAVLDTGINLTHPEFAGRVVAGYDMVNKDDDPSDDHGHGTHTAGIIAADIDNELGIAGVCPHCSLMPIKVLNQNNSGTWSGVAQGILYAADHGARIISMSLGAAVSSRTLEEAVQYAQAKGVLLIAASGNMGVERNFYPAALDGVIAVSATDETDVRWVYSNWGAFVDVAAPGSAIYSTFNNLTNAYGGYTYMSGTSMATPHVAGLAGLLLSQNPARSAADLTRLITTTADDLGDPGVDLYYGYGRINLEKALAVEADVQWELVAGAEAEEAPNKEAENSTGITKLFLPLFVHHSENP